MKLIADGGSTKTEWCLCNNGRLVKRIFTGGINPYILDDDEISHLLINDLLPQLDNNKINEIYFYGSGCRDAVIPRMTEVFSKAFGCNADNIHVYSDMLASARALLNHKSGIACILGTGSNSCYYDGENIVENTPALGYILGDEGSGSNIGKTLVNAIYKRRMPEVIVKKFESDCNLNQDEVIKRTYKCSEPGRFLASLTHFVADNIEYPGMQNLVTECFRNFFRNNIAPYGKKDCTIAAIGGVAFHFKDLLSKAAETEGFKLDKVIQSPMSGLLEYHEVKE